jgi:hypothetical protein
MILTLKLLLTPILITLATLTGRRWGPAVSGWLIGFPLTSGPVSVILALQYGSGFASQAAVGNLGGLASICAFCLIYTFVSRSASAWFSLATAIAAYLAATILWNQFTLSLWPTVLIALGANVAVIWLIPKGNVTPPDAPVPSWDIPVRIVVATSFVLALTTAASVLGPQLSGLITPFPIFGSVLAVFAHRQQGAHAARHFLRGHAISLFGFAAFFIMVGTLLPALAPAWTYLLATGAAIGVNSATLRVINGSRPRPLPEPGACGDSATTVPGSDPAGSPR